MGVGTGGWLAVVGTGGHGGRGAWCGCHGWLPLGLVWEVVLVVLVMQMVEVVVVYVGVWWVVVCGSGVVWGVVAWACRAVFVVSW